MATARKDPGINGVVITPGADLVRGLPPGVREELYGRLAGSALNADQVHAFRYPGEAVEAWLGSSLISPATRRFIEPLIYWHGRHMYVADTELVRLQISDPEELRRLAKALLHQKTSRVRLLVPILAEVPRARELPVDGVELPQRGARQPASRCPRGRRSPAAGPPSRREPPRTRRRRGPARRAGRRRSRLVQALPRRDAHAARLARRGIADVPHEHHEGLRALWFRREGLRDAAAPALEPGRDVRVPPACPGFAVMVIPGVVRIDTEAMRRLWPKAWSDVVQVIRRRAETMPTTAERTPHPLRTEAEADGSPRAVPARRRAGGRSARARAA